MKKHLIDLLIKECCTGKKCKNCNFKNRKNHCCLLDIINIIENYK